MRIGNKSILIKTQGQSEVKPEWGDLSKIPA